MRSSAFSYLINSLVAISDLSTFATFSMAAIAAFFNGDVSEEEAHILVDAYNGKCERLKNAHSPNIKESSRGR